MLKCGEKVVWWSGGLVVWGDGEMGRWGVNLFQDKTLKNTGYY